MNGTVRGRLMRVVLLTTAIAMCVAGLAILSYNLSVYRASSASDLSTEAAILSLSTAPALQFDDRALAERNLTALQARRRVVMAALYSANGALYASYVRGHEELPPRSLRGDFLRIRGDRVELAQPVQRQGETVGYIYLEERYDVLGRFAAYLGIFGLVISLSIAVAYLLASRLQRGISEPLDSMVGAAREIANRRNYAVRARKFADDEIGVLVDAFNNMLEEVEARTIALREADRRKDEFLATLAHELRNPLAPIRHAVRLLESKSLEDGKRQWARDVISRQVQRMALLLDDLLDVSRITRGRLELKIEIVDLGTLVGAAVETARPLIESKQHRLDVELPPGGVMVKVDPLRVSQSLSNLLTNAAKYTDPRGRISLSVRLTGEEIVMSVRDNGIGFEAQSFEDMFTMFAQVDSALDRSEGGLGIGLALVKGLIALHGGTVSGTSEGLGRGSEFAIHLPRSVVVNAAAPGAAVHMPPVPQPSRAALRIVVADDNRDAADSLALLLQASGHEVWVSHTGAAALDLARSHSPDAMVLDIGMPDLSGYEVASAVRAAFPGRPLLLIAVTGWGQAEDKERARRAGFDHHLTKPVDIDQLERLLAQFCEARRRAREGEGAGTLGGA